MVFGVVCVWVVVGGWVGGVGGGGGGGGAQGGRLYTVCPLSRVSPGHLGWGVGWGDAGLRLHMKKPQMA